MALKKSQIYTSLWQSCGELRGGMDASQYKDYILTLLFLKYVSDKYSCDRGLLRIPPGASFADIAKLKGNKEIGERINKIIAALDRLILRKQGRNWNDVPATWKREGAEARGCCGRAASPVCPSHISRLALSRHQVSVLRKSMYKRELVRLMAALGRTDRTKFRSQGIGSLLDTYVRTEESSRVQRGYLLDRLAVVDGCEIGTEGVAGEEHARRGVLSSLAHGAQ